MVKNLRQLRLSKGISQQKLADMLGITQQAINRMNGRKLSRTSRRSLRWPTILAQPWTTWWAMTQNRTGSAPRRILNQTGRNGLFFGTTANSPRGKRTASWLSSRTIPKNKRHRESPVPLSVPLYSSSSSSGASQLCQTFCTSSLSSRRSSIFCIFTMVSSSEMAV